MTAAANSEQPKRGPGRPPRNAAPEFAPPNRQVQLIGVEGDGSSRPPGGTKPGGAKTGAAKSSKAEEMTAAKVQSGLSAVFTVLTMTTRNPRYMLTPEESAAFAPHFQTIADGVNAMPDWLKASITKSSASAGALGALGFVIFAKYEQANKPDDAEFREVG